MPTSTWFVTSLIISSVTNLTDFQYIGRHRWVEYASKSRYNASQVPAEWHGWLHFITDRTGDEVSHLFILTYKTYIASKAYFKSIKCSCCCWNRRGMELSIERTCLVRVSNTYTIRRVMRSTLGKETGLGTNPGNLPRNKFFVSLSMRRARMEVIGDVAPIFSINSFILVWRHWIV